MRKLGAGGWFLYLILDLFLIYSWATHKLCGFFLTPLNSCRKLNILFNFNSAQYSRISNFILELSSKLYKPSSGSGIIILLCVFCRSCLYLLRKSCVLGTRQTTTLRPKLNECVVLRYVHWL